MKILLIILAIISLPISYVIFEVCLEKFVPVPAAVIVAILAALTLAVWIARLK